MTEAAHSQQRAHPDAQPSSHLSDILVAQTIRQIEEDGPLEDGEAMAYAFANARSREDRLLARARILGRRLKLHQEISRWRELAPYVWLALSFLVFFIAYGIAVAVLGGERSLNAVLALFVTLGMHALTLLIWLLSLVIARGPTRSTATGLSLGSLLLRLVAWLPLDRGPHSLVMLGATNATLQGARLLPWAFGLVSHTIWAFAFVLILAALWFAFSFQQYRLTWETTILSADFFIQFVQLSGWLPHLLGFPLPDTATVLDPAAPGGDQRAWAWWLIGCTFVYGLVPRVALAALCWVVWQRGKQSLRLDTSAPYYRKLMMRFEQMEASVVVDHEQRPTPSSPSTSAANSVSASGSIDLAIIGFELPAEYPWPPAPLHESAQMTERISGSSQERRSLLDTLAQRRPDKLLVLCNATSSPDRGTERFIREACGHAGHCALLLANAGAGDGTQRWQAWLADSGLGEVQSFADVDDAAAWSKQQRASRMEKPDE